MSAPTGSALFTSAAIGAVLFSLPTTVARAQCVCDAAAIEAVGHRGTGVDTADNAFPENTIVSFEEAVREGAKMIELDVHHSADGALIVIHDDRVNRTTDGEGCVGDLTLEELQALDAGGEQIPTLEEVFAAVDVGINIEIKVNEASECPPTDRPRLGSDVASLIAEDAAASGDREVIVSSFDLEALLAVRAADASVPLGLLYLDPADLDIAIDQDLTFAHPLGLAVTAADVERAHAAGLAVNAWTVNDGPTVRRLALFGVDRIITDDPAVVLSALAAYCDALTCDDGGPASDGGDAGMMPDGGSAGADGGGCSALGADIGGSARAAGPSGATSVAAVLLAALLLRRRRR